MEYTMKTGRKVIVEGDKVKYGDFRMQRRVIGANFTHGTTHGGYLSSFNGTFTDEEIGVQSGLGDIVNVKIGDITDAYELLKSKVKGLESPDINSLSQAVLETVEEYFGGHENTDTRMDYYYPVDEEGHENNMVSNLKGSGSAMCVERAALAQNLLRSLGINSFYKSSGIIRNDNREVHSYNLIEQDGKYYVFDTSIPNLINGSASPLIVEIDKTTFEALSNPLHDTGISLTTEHYSPYRDENVCITYDAGRSESLKVDAIGSTNKQMWGRVICYFLKRRRKRIQKGLK